MNSPQGTSGDQHRGSGAAAPLLRPTPRPRLRQRLQTDFLTGLVVVAPVYITGYLAWTFVDIVDETIVPLIPARYHPENALGFHIPGIGLIVFIVFTTLVGALAKNLIGRTIIRWGERLLHRMPVVRTIYNAIKQIAETALSQSQTSFRHACVIEYPRPGIWAIGFVSTTTGGEVSRRIPHGPLLSVFLPTTPNPTSGFLLFVPKRDVILLNMTVEEAAKLVISAGLVDPGASTQRNTESALSSGIPTRPTRPPGGSRTSRCAPESEVHATRRTERLSSTRTGPRRPPR